MTFTLTEYMSLEGKHRGLLKIVHPYNPPNTYLLYDDPAYTLNTNSLLAGYTF